MYRLGLFSFAVSNKRYFPPLRPMQCLLPWISVQHPMNIHVNINLHQKSGFRNEDTQASQEMKITRMILCITPG